MIEFDSIRTGIGTARIIANFRSHEQYDCFNINNI